MSEQMYVATGPKGVAIAEHLNNLHSSLNSQTVTRESRTQFQKTTNPVKLSATPAVSQDPYMASANAEENTIIMNGYDQEDRDFFRPSEQIPTDGPSINRWCFQAYDRFPIIRNVIDLMADFTVSGITIVNKSKSAQKFAREWMERINLPERAERIAHMLYLCGTVPIRRTIGRLPDSFKPINKPRTNRVSKIGLGKIPMGYTVMDPRWLNPPPINPTSEHVDVSRYTITSVLDIGATPTKGPFSWLGGVSGNSFAQQNLNPLTDTLLFYKKCDHDTMPKPLLYPLFRDLQILEKLRMSDVAALDGATSKTRLWQLGDKDLEVMPTEAAYERLSSLLKQSTGGGVQDLIWDFMLTVKETTTDLHNFLGREKYVPTLEAIFQGLGIPPSLAGSESKAGYTNNFVSLRTLTERLQYGRSVITAFLMAELEMLQIAMGFRHPFIIVFDEPSLSDETAEKQIILDMWDRGLVSAEFVVERMGGIPEVEETRVNREYHDRKDGRLPPKAGPFSPDSQQAANLERTFANQGLLTPSQVGLEYPEKKPGEKTILDHQAERAKKANQAAQKQQQKLAVSPETENGRPKLAKDKTKRKEKRVVPLASGSAYALAAIASIDEYRKRLDTVIQPAYLKMAGKSNLRLLTQAEADDLEELCFLALCYMDPNSAPTLESAASVFGSDLTIPEPVHQIYSESLTAMSVAGKPVTLEQKRYLRAAAVALYGVNIHTQEDE